MLLVFFLAYCLLDCGGDALPPTDDLSGEELARIHCGSCHQFPVPARLSKHFWRTRVLPQMAYRLGVKDPEYAVQINMQEEQQMREAGMFTNVAVIDSQAWRKIVDYYLREAPDSLPAPADRQKVVPGLDRFKPRDVDLGLGAEALTCLLHWSPEQERLYVGDGRNQLLRLNGAGEIVDRFRLQSPPLAVHAYPDGSAYLLAVGYFHPNDTPRGQLYHLSADGKIKSLLEGLPRPVDMAFADLDDDGREDFVLCGFGHFSGRLSWFRSLGGEQFEENVLVSTPGAVKTYIIDFNGDGRPDILTLLAQGDERILVHYNEGGGQFREERLLRFDPVFGSVYFEPVDFDADGDLDILYVNGDNADFSYCLKPYHGLRLFENDGNNQFSEAFFFPIYGAFKVQARDFDADGDLDLAAISFFPDFEGAPEESFVYLENISDSAGSPYRFAPATFEVSPRGRWITMESADFDGDGDDDIALGSFVFSPTPSPPALTRQWAETGPNVLMLLNQ